MIGRKTRRPSAVATTQRIGDMKSKATRASVCNQPMKQAGAFEDSTEFQLAPPPPHRVRERPTTSRVCRHNETARKRARQAIPSCKGERASHHSAPQFVARVTMMNAHLIAPLPGVMVTNRDHRRKKHIITRRYTLQSVVGFFIHVEKP